MSDQYQAGGSPTSSGPSAAGFASGEPESTLVRGVPPAAGETSATSEETTAAVSGRTVTSSGPTTSPTTEPQGTRAAEPQGTPTAEPRSTRNTPDEEAAAGEEPATGERSNGGIRAWATRIGLGAPAGRSSEERAAEERAGEGVAVAATATAPGGGPRDGDAGAPGRPKKPMLAGAAMAGAVLIAVPLLVMATNKDEHNSKKVASSADTVLGDDGSKEGEFVAESPSPKASKGEKKESSAPSAGSSPPAAEASEGGNDEGGEEDGKGGGAKKGKSEKKKGKHTKAAPSKHSNALPAVLTRVLIKNNRNKTCVDIPGYDKGRRDGDIVQGVCNNATSDNQLWTARKKYDSAGPGGAPLFVIRNAKDHMCLDLPGYGAANQGQKVTEFACKGTTSDNQLWWLDKRPDGKFWLRNVASHNMCLDSPESKGDRSSLLIWPCSPSDNHEWFFTRS